MVAQNVFFYLFAALILGAALAVVTSRNVVRAALYLAMVFAGVAGIYLLLAAEFVAATQILVYLGAIMVLMLFGIMLTRARIGVESDLTHKHWWFGAVTAVGLLGVMGYALVDSYEDQPLATNEDGVTHETPDGRVVPIDDDLRVADVVSTGYGSELPRDDDADDAEPEGSNVATVSDAIFGTYLVPFEAVSVLLLAALVGAVVIARKDR